MRSERIWPYGVEHHALELEGAAIDGHFHKRGISSCARLGGGAGRTRTNHQSVMEYGPVRPAHPVEHHTLELEQFRFLGISTKGESAVTPECVVELVGLETATRLLMNAVLVRPAPHNGA